MSPLFYLQDSRSYVGNDVLFWCATGGYTSDLSKAEVFSKDAAVRQHQVRPTDIPWAKEYMDGKTRPAVDMQYIRREDALRGTGITLVKPVKYRMRALRCAGCNRFISQEDMYLRECAHCGQDNRP